MITWKWIYKESRITRLVFHPITPQLTQKNATYTQRWTLEKVTDPTIMFLHFHIFMWECGRISDDEDLDHQDSNDWAYTLFPTTVSFSWSPSTLCWHSPQMHGFGWCLQLKKEQALHHGRTTLMWREGQGRNVSILPLKTILGYRKPEKVVRRF